MRILRQYGLTGEQYAAMLEDQDGRCAICRNVLVDGASQKDKRRAVVDHCHVRERTRAILCQACNVMLGEAGDDPEVLRRGADYLEEHLQRDSSR